MPSSHNYFLIVRILFTHPEHFMSCFHFFPPKVIMSKFFILMYLNPFKYLHSFSNSSHKLCLCYFHFQFLRWFVQDFSSFVIVSIHSLFPNTTRDPLRPSQVCTISILIRSTRISSRPNPLLFINLNW